jgi:YD repeat-containing protein
MRRGISVLRAVLLGSTLSTAQQLCAQSTPSSFTTGYRYDIGGRLVGEIKPDPDGSTGPLHYPATRYTYSASGLLTKVEKGELATWQSEAVAPANWTGFTIFTAEKHSYSPFGQVAATAVSAGGTTYSVTQQNYDSFLYPKCTAVRMNQGAFPTIPANEFQALPTDACSLGTQGSDGPDRIMKTTYDTLGRLQTIQKALGVTTANGFPSTLQQTYASYTYTPSFKIDTITDANGNVAKFTYDGLDRQQCWIFPSKTTGQVSGDCVSAGSAGGDYEKYAYDTAGNRTSFTRRDGRIIRYTYDALGRLASKCVTATTACVVPNATTGRDVYYGYDLLGRMTAPRSRADAACPMARGRSTRGAGRRFRSSLSPAAR